MENNNKSDSKDKRTSKQTSKKDVKPLENYLNLNLSF
jgi:hypothetical protein